MRHSDQVTPALALPSREETDGFDQQFNTVTQQLERIQEDIIRKTEERDKIEAELRMIETTHDVPSEEDLTAARDRRDTGWRLIRRVLEGNGAQTEDIERFAPSVSLPDAFEESMNRAAEKAAPAAKDYFVDAIKEMSIEDAGNILADAVVEIMRKVEMPNGLSAVGYGPNDVDKLVAGTLPQHRVTKLSPRPVGAEDLKQLFLDSLTLW